MAQSKSQIANIKSQTANIKPQLINQSYNSTKIKADKIIKCVNCYHLNWNHGHRV